MKKIQNAISLAAAVFAITVLIGTESAMARGAYHFFENGVYREVYGSQSKCKKDGRRHGFSCYRFGRLCNHTYYATRTSLRYAKARLKRGSKLELKKLRQGITVCTVRPKK